MFEVSILNVFMCLDFSFVLLKLFKKNRVYDSMNRYLFGNLFNFVVQYVIFILC